MPPRARGARPRIADHALALPQAKDTSHPMVVLVTGSAGFVGFHAAAALKREGHGVVGLDNFNSYYSVSLKRARAAALADAGVHTAAADLNDAPAVRSLRRRRAAIQAHRTTAI